MSLFARNEEINQWLSDHPVVLGLGALVLALILIALGISALITGKAPTKRGRDLEGGNAMVMAIVWLVFGGLCLLFAIYKIISGLI